ncbi:hypothetical protein GGP41_007213 [Bipolaris sorokiniana]|uniref:RNase III domain-containing protein n=2 Tax=Cochliobolus sativus TaxID=45130 RepID=A0A8H5ZRK0_COCSA|nr:uncharacterized protein COCSADRAFT_34131 [Bipolaris sorokiniana ND90Pr]EMD67299.1 hypothetical protein COCSADRAFT_34131 [Bipolaris sorokiniana ND90Pr]KAF5854362.1 hypothetical protein GGP41_007213 [Bipolaris sorokiniana]
MAQRSIEIILQYSFSNHQLLDEALLAAGAPASSKDIEGEVHGNKRLALLGDSVLKEVILEPWYSSEKSTEEGNNRVRDLCRNTKLSQVAQESGISSHITLNPCQQGRVSQETAASTVEALVGAVYLDSGKDISKVKDVLETIGFFEAE